MQGSRILKRPHLPTSAARSCRASCLWRMKATGLLLLPLQRLQVVLKEATRCRLCPSWTSPRLGIACWCCASPGSRRFSVGRRRSKSGAALAGMGGSGLAAGAKSTAAWTSWTRRRWPSRSFETRAPCTIGQLTNPCPTTRSLVGRCLAPGPWSPPCHTGALVRPSSGICSERRRTTCLPKAEKKRAIAPEGNGAGEEEEREEKEQAQLRRHLTTQLDEDGGDGSQQDGAEMEVGEPASASEPCPFDECEGDQVREERVKIQTAGGDGQQS